jgi:hypothetical protein
MGSIGDCCDNAVIESSWSRMQVELLDRHRWRTRLEPANAMFDYRPAGTFAGTAPRTGRERQYRRVRTAPSTRS